MDREKNTPPTWLKRVEDIINVLEGSSIGELRLTEGETEITIRRNPDMVLTTAPTTIEIPLGSPGTNSTRSGQKPKVDNSMPITAPLTGVYYAAASPTAPPFVNTGEIIHVGQVVALVEAMKVFNEINAEVSGRIISLVAKNGNVVQKGDILMLVEPL
jgi:acetyl-CoA carboxylase biotin carboxyl carrier protein